MIVSRVIRSANRVKWVRLDSQLGRVTAVCLGQCRDYHRTGAVSRRAVTTVERYPHVRRGSYSRLERADVDHFRSILPGESQIIEADSELEAYNTDWLGTVCGSGPIVLRPQSTTQVSAVLAHCHARRLAVVPQGGNTGLVAGSIPVFDEVILSLQLMNSVMSVDHAAGVLVCEAGCVLETLDNLLGEKQLMMPLDLGSKGSCQIGGNVSTNAGGVRLLRYGSLHGNVLGIEAVLADGTIVDCLSKLRKDNTGYDLKQLFIGSEGTLGVVTAVSVLCPQRPQSTNVAFLGCLSFADVLRVLALARSSLCEILSAFEFLDAEALLCACDNLRLRRPLQRDSPFYVLVETSGSDADHDAQKLERFLDTALSSGLVEDGTMATSGAKIKELWEVRERLAEALLCDGHTYKYDVSLPLSSYYELVTAMRDRLAGKATRVIAYGHVGDGNLHFNVTSPTFDEDILATIEPFLYEWTSAHEGSISAEHGMGLAKNRHLHHSKSAAAIAMMSAMKRLLDPKTILNPYKTLPPS